MAKGQQPRAALQPQSKQPRMVAADPRSRTPVWSFARTDYDGPFQWRIPVDQQRDVFTRLGALENTPWGEIDGHQNHFVLIANLSKEARQRLQAIQQDDVEHLYSLRVMSAQRIWGIRDGNTLRLLWWDPEHQVCPSTTHKA